MPKRARKGRKVFMENKKTLSVELSKHDWNTVSQAIDFARVAMAKVFSDYDRAVLMSLSSIINKNVIVPKVGI
jgi:hypothetical protein